MAVPPSSLGTKLPCFLDLGEGIFAPGDMKIISQVSGIPDLDTLMRFGT